jgi:[acyl-carrier-protein] S-malonyltransferase
MINQPYAFIFPGQGSQSVGMLKDALAQFPEISATFAEASEVLGYDLGHLVFEGPAEELNQTIHTQPALLAASYAVWRIITARSEIAPVMLAGHSLGEYTALVCAESLNFRDAIKLVAARGRFMQDAVRAGEGAMAAIIGLEDGDVVSLCDTVRADTGQILSPANYNSVGQIVIAGHEASVKRAIDLAKEQGAKMAVLIPVSVPSHCELMRPAAERLADLLATISIQSPVIPVINNADVASYQDADAIRDALVRQLFMPVRWVEIIRAMMNVKINTIIECGPGKVLSGLNKRIDKTLQLYSVNDLASIESILTIANERNAS